MDPNEREKAWYDLVVEYTSRSLTKPTDTLPAISGLASLLWGDHKYEYIAGLLKHDIHRGLTWYVPPESRRRLVVRKEDHLETYIPSWSWASADYKVNFHFNNFNDGRHHAIGSGEMHRNRAIQNKKLSDNIQLAIIQASLDTVGRDPFGQVSSGYLKVKGRVLPVDSTVDGIYWDEPDRQKEKSMLLYETKRGLLLAVDAFGNGWGVLVLIQVPSKPNHYQRIGYFHRLDNGLSRDPEECPFYNAPIKELILI